MSFITILFRKALSGVLFIVNIFKRIIGIFWRRKENNIGELPFIAPSAVISQGGYQQQLHHGDGHNGKLWEFASFKRLKNLMTSATREMGVVENKYKKTLK